jgi:hypothetical protein
VGVLVAQLGQGRGVRGARVLLLRFRHGSSQGSETGQSEALTSAFGAAPFWQRVFSAASASSAQEDTVAAPLKIIRDFLRVDVRGQPAKSPRGIHGFLGRCALPHTPMAKVELHALG